MTDTADPWMTGIAPAARQCLEIWEKLDRVHTMIGGSCSCGTHGIVLRLADFEQDIGDYLRSEGQQHQRRDVVQLLEQYAVAGERWSLPALLSRLTDAGDHTDTAAARFILERLMRSVQSFEDLHRPR